MKNINRNRHAAGKPVGGIGEAMSKCRNTRKKPVLSGTMTMAELEEWFASEFLKLQRSRNRKQRQSRSIGKPTPTDMWTDRCAAGPKTKPVKPAIH